MDYKIHTDVKFGALELVDAGRLADECNETWWNQTLCWVNDCVVRLGVFEGEFHWHSHEQEDELFLVLEGRLLLDRRAARWSSRRGRGWSCHGRSGTAPGRRRGPRAGPTSAA